MSGDHGHRWIVSCHLLHLSMAGEPTGPQKLTRAPWSHQGAITKKSWHIEVWVRTLMSRVQRKFEEREI